MQLKKSVKNIFTKSLPESIKGNYKIVPESAVREFEDFLRKEYYSKYTTFDESHDLRQDLSDQMHSRLDRVRTKIIPWLASVKSLPGVRVLEIGCGTGSSLVALSEQGMQVTGLDIDAVSLQVAKKRLEIYGLKAELVEGNAQELSSVFKGRHFDFIIFSATVEHMTLQERLQSLRAAKQLMHVGDYLVIVETPNRLWHYDFHTSLLPFYFWLPDELAFQYTHYSRRKNFGDVYQKKTPERFMHFLRRGRGVSYHDFEIAFGGFADIKLVSGLDNYLIHPWARAILDRLKSRRYHRHKKTLRSIGPPLPEAFFEPWLNLLFKKI
jgi:S-adenosylmethionine-dependent methyltransferase